MQKGALCSCGDAVLLPFQSVVSALCMVLTMAIVGVKNVIANKMDAHTVSFKSACYPSFTAESRAGRLLRRRCS